jgi:hypothetical protein
MTRTPKTKKIEIDGKAVEVGVLEPTFFEVQSLASLFSAAEFNLVQYWLTAFEMWLDIPNDISLKDLSIEEGMELRKLVPHPDQVVEWLSFREAKSATL